MPVENLGESYYALYGSHGEYWRPSFGFNSKSFEDGQAVSMHLYLKWPYANDAFPSCLTSYQNFEVVSCSVSLSSNAYYRFNNLHYTGVDDAYFQDTSVSGTNYYIMSIIVRIHGDVTINHIELDGRLVSGATNVSKAVLLSVERFGHYSSAVSLDDIIKSISGSDSIKSSIDEQTQQDQEHWEQAQDTFDDAQDDADSDSDSSSQQATSSGTTLLSGFQSFLGALTGASPSNCVISADLGNMDLGNIDLCELDPPPAFQAISSIMVIGFTVPLSLALGKKMIALFRSFQT